MYFVDKDLLEKRLQYFEMLMEELSLLSRPEDHTHKLALQRISHMMIETVMDVGNQLIDAFVMRDPGGYGDIIDILVDERVISSDNGQSLHVLLPWRKALLHDYIALDNEQLYEAFRKESRTLRHFPAKVRRYIEEEQGPVSAFLPEKE